MNILSIAILVLFTAGEAAKADGCLNFSGLYKNTNADSEVSVHQVDCDLITLTYLPDRESQEFILDGVKHKMFESATITWWATASFAQNREDVFIENETVFANGKTVRSTRKLSLDSTFDPGKVYLLDQRGETRADGIFIPKESESYLKK